MNSPLTALGGRNLQFYLPIITGPLLDNARIGALGIVCAQRVIGTGDTNLPHQLGRVPNGYIVYRRPNIGGGSITPDVTDPTSGATLWTPTQITLAATVAGTYWLILL